VSDYTFTGQRAERGFGLMDYQARYYDPKLGRFVSADTVVPSYATPQTLNRYAYSYNNPVRYYDSDGHCAPFCGLLFTWLAFDYLPRETLAAGARAVAPLDIPLVSDLAALDVRATDQFWTAVNGDELGLTTKQRIDAAGEGEIAALDEAFVVYGFIEAIMAARDTLDQVRSSPSPASRLPERPNDKGKTTGILVADGQEYGPIVSGKSGPAADIPRGTPGFNGVTKTHVEGHASAIMRQTGAINGTLYINNQPCLGPRGCDSMLPRMLPEDATLRVVGPNGFDKTYTGIPD
jgi:RHS repeat-associated protein